MKFHPIKIGLAVSARHLGGIQRTTTHMPPPCIRFNQSTIVFKSRPDAQPSAQGIATALSRDNCFQGRDNDLCALTLELKGVLPSGGVVAATRTTGSVGVGHGVYAGVES